MYPIWINEALICPETQEKLNFTGSRYHRADGFSYPVNNEILSAVYPKELAGDDAKFNRMYNFYAPLYDLSELGMRVLEVSPGPGVFQKYLRHEVGENGELVALDLSMGMLRQCQKKNVNLNVHLVHGNAQYLPFADNTFDALYHFGGVNLFNEPDKAISEFIRVVKKDGIVSWGDEGFSPNYRNERRKKIMLKINPGFAKSRPFMPDSVYDVHENEVYDGLAYLVVAKKR